MTIRFSAEEFTRLPGLLSIQNAHPDRFSGEGVTVRFEPGWAPLGFSVTQEADGLLVRYAAPCDAYRAVGLLLAADRTPENFSQERAHTIVGVMWDLSRNGVLHGEAWEKLLLKFALLGINAVQLYMEDVYALEDEPFFGYGRGRYSREELRRIDAAGHALGIEIVPCIQTLGHLSQIFQWPAYAEIRDISGVLLVGDDRTRHLIEKMLDTVAACFQTRTIHIGMDEAHGIGKGKYLEQHGLERPFDILTRHLNLVVELCRKRGLQPMMWSDMFFRIGSSTHDYYDQTAVIPQEVASQIPADVDLVYWDYYHTDSAFYDEWIRRHRELGKEPIFAGGAWTWGRFWANARLWRKTLHAGMGSARKHRLAQTLLTVWGDDGDEFHPASALPAVQYFAEWAYAGEPDDQALHRQFAVISSGSPLEDSLKASQLDEVSAECTINPSKWILWHDPVLGFLNAHLTADLPAHYAALATALEKPGADESIRFAAQVARTVGLKAELHLKARAAWQAGDREELRRLRKTVLPDCQKGLRSLWETHRTIWSQWKKPFGWEVIEGRYASTSARLESLGALLDTCLNNPEASVPEWEPEPQPVIAHGAEVYFTHSQTNTPSFIK